LPDVEHYIVIVDGPVRSPRRFFKTVLSQACFGKIGMISVSSNYLSERIEGKSSYRVHVDEMYGVPVEETPQENNSNFPKRIVSVS
jgi:hypothetical protein